MDSQQKTQVLEHLKSANNVLVAVNSNPTVDELAASIGLTLALNKLDKHATTVFSGVVPSTIEFLQPEKTIETTTDSLRDFIIALDKSKADKLRYKVEDDVVRIFITPYHTTITEKDLAFSHGDFNVDVVVALGVKRQADLDKAITAHGRILHDATVVVVSKQQDGNELGTLTWQDPKASSLCEMVASMMLEAGKDLVDGQMATAFLTGIIAETDRFKNDKTTPLALSVSSQLMSVGANQQLIAEKLEAPPAPLVTLTQTDSEQPEEQVPDDGTLNISHDEPGEAEDEINKIHIDDHGNLAPHDEPSENTGENSQITEHGLSNSSGLPSFASPEPAPTQEQEDTRSEIGLPPEEKEELPVLEQPDTALPLMEHSKKIIEPPSSSQSPKSDKPFDLNEALQAASEPDITGPTQVGAGSTLPSTDAPAAFAPTTEPGVPISSSRPPSDQPAPPAATEEPVAPAPMPPPAPAPATPSDHTDGSQGDEQTLIELEQAVNSPHIEDSDEGSVKPPPDMPVPVPMPADNSPLVSPAASAPSTVNNPTAPPPVPPPMTAAPMFYDPDGTNSNPFLNPPSSPSS